MRAKLVPKLLIDEQKGRSVKMCQKLLNCVRDDPNCLEDIITGEESWFLSMTQMENTKFPNRISLPHFGPKRPG